MEDLEVYVNRLIKNSGDLYRVLRDVYDGYRSGEIELIDPRPPRSYIEYLLRIDYSLWLWATGSLVILTLAVIAITDIVPQLLPLRYVLGSIYVLYIPGYSLVEALYPYEKSLSPLERVALSIGLSLAVVPLIGLILNYTPWGIRLGPIVTALSIYTSIMLLIASYRKYRVSSIINKGMHVRQSFKS